MQRFELVLRRIGVIKTQFESSEGVPVQSSKSEAMGEAVVYEEFIPGLESLDCFTHAILIYWYHRSTRPELLLTPYLDSRERGVFSTRAPSRPNPVGLSVMEIREVRRERVLSKGADMINNTPLLDIKHFVPEFDNRPEANSGWLEKHLHDSSQSFVADDRYQARAKSSQRILMRCPAINSQFMRRSPPSTTPFHVLTPHRGMYPSFLDGSF